MGAFFVKALQFGGELCEQNHAGEEFGYVGWMIKKRCELIR